MEPLAIADKLQDMFPDDVLEVVESRGQVGVVVRRDHVVEICGWLHDEPDLQMNHLLDLCGVDYREKNKSFEVVYNLYSIPLQHMIRLRARIPAEDCWIDSVTPVWRGADWHERECYDLVGIVFKGHPDLRRILLPEDWEGHPLRKDYPLRLKQENEWSGYEDLKDLARRLRQFEFHGDEMDGPVASADDSTQEAGDVSN